MDNTEDINSITDSITDTENIIETDDTEIDVITDDLITSDNKSSKIQNIVTIENNLTDDEIILNEDDISKHQEVSNNEKITIPRLTKYERVRILGCRAKQISDGAKVLVKNVTGKSSMDIALLELKYKVIPLKIKRTLPNGKYEIWSIKDLEVLD